MRRFGKAMAALAVAACTLFGGVATANADENYYGDLGSTKVGTPAVSDVGAHTANVSFDYQIDPSILPKVQSVCFAVEVMRVTSIKPIKDPQFGGVPSYSSLSCSGGTSDGDLTSGSYQSIFGTKTWPVKLGEDVQSYATGQMFSSYDTDMWNHAASGTVQMTVITDIAQTWLALGASKMQYKLARETLTSQEESYRLIVRSYELGASSQLDVQQAAQTVAAAQAAAVQAERAVSQYRNALRLLAGGTYDPALEPEGIETATVAAVSVAGNIPSEVLLNRPDIAQAEAVLRSANANIGVARAAFFPSISLTGAFGGGSTQLSDLFDHATKIWSWAPQISLPIFTGGANISNLRAAEARQKSALADYEAAIQAAFKDVADALAMEGTVERELSARRDFAKAAAESYRLATDRYKNGADSYLSVLDSQRTNFSAQQALITAELSRAASLITLYKAMGGASELAEPEGESK